MRKFIHIARPILALLIAGGVFASPCRLSAADDKKAEAATVKDGLSLNVVATLPVFAADQTPSFDVTFTNLRDSAFSLAPGIHMVDAWSIIAKETGTGATYRVVCTDTYLRRALEITTLASKDARTVHLKLDPAHFQFIPLQPQAAAPVAAAHLPAGNYELTLTIKFESIADIHDPKPIPWVGEIKTNAVVFAIAAEQKK